MNFQHAPTHPQEIFKLIARVSEGRQILEQFLSLYRSGQVTLVPYPESVLQRLRSVLGEGQPVGACFTNDGIHGSIHYDPSAPLGVLGPFLLHEMVHALDMDLWYTAQRPQSLRARERVMLRAESRAFEIQSRFVQALRNKDPEFDRFLREQQGRVRILIEKLTEAEIAELYGYAS